VRGGDGRLAVAKRNERISDVDKVETHVYTPPKDYGKIDIADFDPENYKSSAPYASSSSST